MKALPTLNLVSSAKKKELGKSHLGFVRALPRRSSGGTKKGVRQVWGEGGDSIPWGKKAEAVGYSVPLYRGAGECYQNSTRHFLRKLQTSTQHLLGDEKTRRTETGRELNAETGASRRKKRCA